LPEDPALAAALVAELVALELALLELVLPELLEPHATTAPDAASAAAANTARRPIVLICTVSSLLDPLENLTSRRYLTDHR
jgi:hypothetical protein